MSQRCWVCKRTFQEAQDHFIEILGEEGHPGNDGSGFGGTLILPMEADGDMKYELGIPLCGVCSIIFSQPCKVIRNEFRPMQR